MYVRYLVKIKDHISYFYNAFLEQQLLHQAWCETWSSSSTKETNWQSWHMFKMSAFGLNTSSQVCWPLVNCTINQAAPHSCGMCVVCHFLWENQVNQFRAPFLTILFLFFFRSYQENHESVTKHRGLLISITFKSKLCLFQYQFEIFTSYLLNFTWQWRHVYVMCKKSKQLIYREYLFLFTDM